MRLAGLCGSIAVCAVQDVFHLVGHALLDQGPAGTNVLPRINNSRVLAERFADGSRHGQPQIRVHVYLAYSHLCGFGQHFLRDADSLLDTTTEFIDCFDIFLID